MSYRALSRSGVLGLVVALVAVLSLSAQAPKSPAETSQTYLATFVTLNQGAVTDYENYLKNDYIPAQKQGGLQARMTYSNGVFGEGPMFATFTPVSSLAQFDQPSPVRKALGDAGAEQLTQKGAKMIASRRTVLIRTRPDLSLATEPKGEPTPLSLITELQVAPGRRLDFEGLIKKEIVPVMQQAKVKAYNVLEIVYGDEVGGYITVVPYESYDAIGKGHPLQTVLGEEGMKRVEAKFAGIVTRMQRHVARYRPELSFMVSKTTSH
jgi:hypothetical protein